MRPSATVSDDLRDAARGALHPVAVQPRTAEEPERAARRDDAVRRALPMCASCSTDAPPLRPNAKRSSAIGRARVGPRRRRVRRGSSRTKISRGSTATRRCSSFPRCTRDSAYLSLEAMAAGACVVARNQSAMAEVLGDTGVQVETRDPPALAAAITALLDDPERRAHAWSRRADARRPVHAGGHGRGAPSPRTCEGACATLSRRCQRRHLLSQLGGAAAADARAPRRQTVDPSRAWEVVVVDNASTDDTAAVAQCLAGRGPAPLRVVSEPQLGLAYARARGIAEARDDIISFVGRRQLAVQRLGADRVRRHAEPPRGRRAGRHRRAGVRDDASGLVRAGRVSLCHRVRRESHPATSPASTCCAAPG